MAKIPACPISAKRAAEVRSGRKPLTEEERNAYDQWRVIVGQVRSASGKKGALKRWPKQKR